MLLLNRPYNCKLVGLSNTFGPSLQSGRVVSSSSCDSVHSDTSYQQKQATQTSKKNFRKNGINVGMATTSIWRKEVSFIYNYVDHTINSARGQQPYILVVLGRVLNLWCDLHIYKAHLFSPDACTCHPYIYSIFPKCFFTCNFVVNFLFLISSRI